MRNYGPVRLNAEDKLRRALRAWQASGTNHAFDALIQVAVRTGQILSLPASVVLRAMAEDPWLLKRTGNEELNTSLSESLTLSGLLHREDWFPNHTVENVCPRGHEFGRTVTMGPDRQGALWQTRVSFSLVEGGTNVYRRVNRAGPSGVTAGYDTERGEGVVYILLCDACDAAWPQRGELDLGGD